MTRIRGVSILAGLAVLGAMFAGAHEARADSIDISGGQVQGPGDPPYIYQFKVSLHDGTLMSGDSFTISNLAGVTPADFPNAGDPPSKTTEPGFFHSQTNFRSWLPEIDLISSAAPYSSDVSWTLMTSSPISTTGTLTLGIFTVETTQSFTAPPITPGNSVSYSYTINGSSTGNSFPIQAGSVPEPSSIVLLLVGGGAVSVLAFRQRRRSRPGH
jgi:hypothetical protein